MASLEKRSQYAAYAEPSVSAGREGPHVLTPSPSTRSGGSGENLAPASKRRRINFACEYCRSRKTRCDEGHPSCYACSAAGIECVTKNRRQPWVDVRRHEAGRVPESSRTGGAQKQGTTGPDLSLGDSTASLAAPSRRHEEVVISPRRRRRQEHRTSEAIDVGESITRTSNERSSRGQPFVLAADAPVTHSRHATQDDDDRPELNTRLPIVQIDSGNTPLELMTSWLDLARYRLQIPHSGHEPANQPTRALSSDCTRSYGDSVLPNSLGTWKLPEQRTAQALLEQFLDGPNVLFPLLQPDKIRRAVKTASLNGTNSLAKGSGLSVLMQVYLVMVLGYASKPGQKVDFDAEGCLKYSESLLGLILQQSKIEALQAVTLLSMALRCYDNLAAAGHTMSLAVSMGVALGLPRYSPRLAPGEERRTTWMSVFAFEKLLAFELGRSSLIPDDYPEVLPDSHYPKHPEQQTRNDEAAAEPRKQPQATFEVVLSLAKLLGDVGRACVQVSRKEDDRSDETMAEVIKEKVRTTGLSCLRLTEWASETCPSRYNPNTDILFDDELHPFASFITMQYHLALILIRRNSLLISEKAIRLAVDVIAKNEPWEFAVRNGQSLCVNSARKILRLFLDCSEHEKYPALPSLAAPLHAMGVLAVFVATRPDSRMASMDREMLKATAVAIKDQQTSSRVQKELDFAVNKFDALVGEAARSHGDAGLRSAQRSRAQSPRLPTESTMREQALGSAAISKHRVAVDSNDSTAQGNGETIEDSPGQWMGSLERDDNLAYSAWWAEDESPMIMDEFGWNWANFSQLLDGHGDEPQMLV